MRFEVLWAAASILLIALVPGVARAQPAPDAHEAADTDREEDDDETVEPSVERREVPDYDGREPQPANGRNAIWIPRVLLAPLYFVTEFVLRRPLSALVRLGEGSSADPLRFFVYGDHQQIALVPTLLIDFGSRPSVGFYLRWNEAGHPNHKLRFHFATWGPDWLKGRVTTRWQTAKFLAELRVAAQRREDGRFAGIGSAARPGPTTARYRFRELIGQLTFEARPWRATELRADFGVRDMRFTDGAYEGPSVEELIEQGVYPQAPPGYENGYFIYFQQLEIDINTRRSAPDNTSGIEVRFVGSQSIDLEGPLARRWLRYGGSLVGHFDVGARHVLALAASFQATEAIAGEIPFTELPELGGGGPLQGFRYGTLYGDSTAALVLRYSWPVWAWLDATLHFGVGNAYDGRFENFTLENQRMGWGIGFSAVDNLDHIFNFILGWGTDTFENGPDVVSFRLALGATWRL